MITVFDMASGERFDETRKETVVAKARNDAHFPDVALGLQEMQVTTPRYVNLPVDLAEVDVARFIDAMQ